MKQEENVKGIKDLKIKIFADGADIAAMKKAHRDGIVKGFTTNPTLMRKAGVTDYRAFAKAVLSEIQDFPISFEVFSDEFGEMERQAHEIASWGKNVNVKIPITNTRGESAVALIQKLSEAKISLNITAILTLEQVKAVAPVLCPGVKNIVSLFCGRIADTGCDPMPYMKEAVAILRDQPFVELLWASPRELLNIFHAEACGCHIITVTNDILKKLPYIGKSLAELSLDTVRMFYNDAKAAGYSLVKS